MIKKILNLFKSKNSKLENYFNLVKDWKIDDHIYFDLNSNEKIYGRIHAFDGNGNLSIKLDSHTYKRYRLNGEGKLYNDVNFSITNEQYININLIDKHYDIFNESLKRRNEELVKNQNRLKSEKIKNNSSDFQKSLEIYREELNRLKLEDLD